MKWVIRSQVLMDFVPTKGLIPMDAVQRLDGGGSDDHFIRKNDSVSRA